MAQAQDVALDRAHLGQAGPLEAGDARQADAGRQHDVLAPQAAPVRQDQLGAVVHRGHGRRLEADAAGLTGLQQRGQQGAVVDLVVARHLDPATDGRAERRHQAAALGRVPAVRLEPERVLVGQEVVERGAIGRVERDGQRSRRVVADGEPRGLLQIGGEGRPQEGTAAQQGGELRLAELRLGDRGQHAGGHPGRTVAPRLRCNDRHLMTVA